MELHRSRDSHDILRAGVFYVVLAKHEVWPSHVDWRRCAKKNSENENLAQEVRCISVGPLPCASRISSIALPAQTI